MVVVGRVGGEAVWFKAEEISVLAFKLRTVVADVGITNVQKSDSQLISHEAKRSQFSHAGSATGSAGIHMRTPSSMTPDRAV